MQRQRRTNLSAGIINQEGNLSRDVDLCLLLCHFLLLRSDRLRASAATILDDVLDASKEGWVAMEVDLPLLGLIPFGIEH